MTTLMKYLFMVGIACGLMACTFGGKPSVMVEQYALEYPSPSIQNIVRIDQVIRIERFSVAKIFNNVNMIYRQKPHSYNDYEYHRWYHRWRANPGDMVGDGLLRDLRATGIFKSVFSYRDMENPDLLLKGGVGEFYESDEKEGRKAMLSVNITLMDRTQKALAKQIIFQKNYRYEEPIPEETVQSFAQGMSRAVEKLSGQVMADVYEAVKNRK
ncbi:MAG: ABC-type transport auxiliary lipoprotein family protein [Deltaproteobacteria bacterium]|nr:ABC-type transport auxiliary lipoprotein family protein [Deltaproteobacteria bacterium]